MATVGTWDQLRAQVDASLQTLEYRVVIDGTERQVQAIEIEQSYDSVCSVANVELTDPYNILPNDPIQVYQGYNGYIWQTFDGFVDIVDVSEYPSRVQVRSRDILKRGVENFLASEDNDVKAAYRVFNNVKAEDAVQRLLEDSQLTKHSIEATLFTIGDPARNAAYEWRINLISAADAIDEVSKLLGWHFWAYLDTAYWRNLDPAPSGTPVWTYADGEGGRIKQLTVTTSDERLRNKIVVFGYGGAKAVRKASSEHLPANYYRTAVLSSELYDTQEICDWLAERVLNELNRLTSYVNITVLGNPLLKMGDTVHVNIATLDNLKGLTADYFVYGVKSRMTASPPSWTMEMALFRGTSSDGFVPGQKGQLGTPDFTYQITRWGDPFYLLSVDASHQPSTFNGDIAMMTVTWDWGDGSPQSTGLRRSHRYDAGSTYTIVMTVRDKIGNVASCQKSIVIGATSGPDKPSARVIWMATNSNALYSPDGGNTWKEKVVATELLSVTCHPTDGTVAIFGGADGKVYLTQDSLQTLTPITLAAGDAVTALFTDQAVPTTHYAGQASGKLWRSVDNGGSWQQVALVAGPITYLVSIPGSDSVFIGHNIYLSQSISQGESPSVFAAFDGSVSDGAIQNYTAYIAIATDVGPYITYDGGATWHDPNISDPIGAITLSAIRWPEALAITTTGDVYTCLSEGSWMLKGTLGVGTAGTDADYDADLPDVAYATSTGASPGLLLTWDDGESWKYLKATSGNANGISYGPLNPIVIPLGVYLGVAKATGDATGGVSYLDPATGTWGWRNNGLPVNPSIIAIASDAGDASAMYVVAGGLIYKSTDGGLNWTSTGFPNWGGSWAVDVYCNDSVAGEVWAAIADNNNYSTLKGAYVSYDGGATWVQKHVSTNFFGLYANPYNIGASGLHVYMGLNTWHANQAWFCRSANGGASWTDSNPTIDWVGSFHGAFVATGRDGGAAVWMWQPVRDVWWQPNISSGGGATWLNPPAGRALYPNQTDWVESFCTLGDGATAYVATQAQKIYRTVDGGLSWQMLYQQSGLVSTLARSSHLRSIIASRDGQTVYCAGPNGNYGYSLDGGVTWALGNTGLNGAGSENRIVHIAEVS